MVQKRQTFESDGWSSKPREVYIYSKGIDNQTLLRFLGHPQVTVIKSASPDPQYTALRYDGEMKVYRDRSLVFEAKSDRESMYRKLNVMFDLGVISKEDYKGAKCAITAFSIPKHLRKKSA